MLQHNHRDMLSKVILLNDYVVWGNGKYGKKMEIVRVIGTTDEKVVVVDNNNKMKRVYPNNLLVITQQVMFNIDNNVGANA